MSLSFFDIDEDEAHREYLEEERQLEEWKEREYAKKQEEQKWQDFIVERRLEELKEGVQ
jgi:hypothetical protein